MPEIAAPWDCKANPLDGLGDGAPQRGDRSSQAPGSARSHRATLPTAQRSISNAAPLPILMWVTVRLGTNNLANNLGLLQRTHPSVTVPRIQRCDQPSSLEEGLMESSFIPGLLHDSLPPFPGGEEKGKVWAVNSRNHWVLGRKQSSFCRYTFFPTGQVGKNLKPKLKAQLSGGG